MDNNDLDMSEASPSTVLFVLSSTAFTILVTKLCDHPGEGRFLALMLLFEIVNLRDVRTVCFALSSCGRSPIIVVARTSRRSRLAVCSGGECGIGVMVDSQTALAPAP